MDKSPTVTLAIFPNHCGFGYARLVNQKELLNCGTTRVRPIFNGSILKNILKKIDFYLPSIVLLEDSECKHNRQGGRIRKLTESIISHAASRGLPVFKYTRQQIRDTFEAWGAKSKYEIAEKLVTWFPDLQEKKIPHRNVYMDTPYYTSVFDALSLAVTHHYLTE